MWDPRYPTLAADRLQALRTEAAEGARLAAAPGALRMRLGVALVRLGERLAAPTVPAAGRPVIAGR